MNSQKERNALLRKRSFVYAFPRPRTFQLFSRHFRNFKSSIDNDSVEFNERMKKIEELSKVAAPSKPKATVVRTSQPQPQQAAPKKPEQAFEVHVEQVHYSLLHNLCLYRIIFASRQL